MIDAHLHLQDPRLFSDADAIVATCQELGISRHIVNGTSPDDWPTVLTLAERYPDFISPSLGLHPWRVNEAPSDWHTTLTDLISHPAVVGIGEIGLDKWIRDHDLPKQKEALRAQLDLAIAYTLPVTLHCLQAWGHLLEVLESTPAIHGRFLLHSYGGPAEMITPFVELGAYFSVSGHSLHPRKRTHLEIVLAELPTDRLLLETDAPDMALPDDLSAHGNSEINHPANLRVIHEQIAQMLGQNLATFIAQTRQNTEALFGIASLNRFAAFPPKR